MSVTQVRLLLQKSCIIDCCRHGSCSFPSLLLHPDGRQSRGPPSRPVCLPQPTGGRKTSKRIVLVCYGATEILLSPRIASINTAAAISKEQEAHPALDKLTSKISTLNLECVRQIKSRLVAITGRVQMVRDELEHLPDDDEDMAEMYLTDKLLQQRLDGTSSTSSLNDKDGRDDNRIPTEISSEVNDVPSSCDADVQNVDDQEHLLAASNAIFGNARAHTTNNSSSALEGRAEMESGGEGRAAAELPLLRHRSQGWSRQWCGRDGAARRREDGTDIHKAF